MVFEDATRNLLRRTQDNNAGRHETRPKTELCMPDRGGDAKWQHLLSDLQEPVRRVSVGEFPYH